MIRIYFYCTDNDATDLVFKHRFQSVPIHQVTTIVYIEKMNFSS